MSVLLFVSITLVMAVFASIIVWVLPPSSRRKLLHWLMPLSIVFIMIISGLVGIAVAGSGGFFLWKYAAQTPSGNIPHAGLGMREFWLWFYAAGSLIALFYGIPRSSYAALRWIDRADKSYEALNKRRMRQELATATVLTTVAFDFAAFSGFIIITTLVGWMLGWAEPWV